ncbi:hypothetical protein ELQ92_03510 [Labedella populi]|uniref:NAD-dependent epimerase/dehydratase family protein n=1 Tax=Labedella populi TaxID=2498850 RepID=A0A444QFA6_9MICO|nr:hypothetical protein [Labedella populi]RWZ68297.1 hypothetical protein ELQ92_03510 [Labedella populi]
MNETKRVAVAGGTGTVGRFVVDALRRDGHDAVVLTRSTGVDLVSGAGLTSALVGAGIGGVLPLRHEDAARRGSARGGRAPRDARDRRE